MLTDERAKYGDGASQALFSLYFRSQCLGPTSSHVDTVRVSCSDSYLLRANALSVRVLILEKRVAEVVFCTPFKMKGGSSTRDSS